MRQEPIFYILSLVLLLISQIVFPQTPGTQKWTFIANSCIFSSPGIGIDGTIYMDSDDNNLYAINSDGTQEWTFATRDEVYSCTAIGADCPNYIGSKDGRLYAIYRPCFDLAQSPRPKFHQNNRNTGKIETLENAINDFQQAISLAPNEIISRMA